MRMLDAAFNRAREALRVLEDAARFALDDGPLCAELKEIRHGLRDALDAAGIHRTDLLAARDTPGDVGTSITTETEARRSGLAGVAAAAGARLGEALRAIEECLKTKGAAGPDAAACIEALRYRVYEAERRLGLALAGGRAPQWRLCVLITGSLCRQPWEEVALAAVTAGADCLQLREKTLDDGELLRRARRLVQVARAAPAAASVIVNDRIDIALLADADGVHLGQQDLPAADARRLAGSRLLIGVSTENLDQARDAARAGADYCGVGPMFPTATKEKPRLAGPAYLKEYLADPVASRLPHLAIGGVTPGNAGAIAQAGGRGAAVSAAVCSADDPGTACRAMLKALAGAATAERPVPAGTTR